MTCAGNLASADLSGWLDSRADVAGSSTHRMPHPVCLPRWSPWTTPGARHPWRYCPWRSRRSGDWEASRPSSAGGRRVRLPRRRAAPLAGDDRRSRGGGAWLDRRDDRSDQSGKGAWRGYSPFVPTSHLPGASTSPLSFRNAEVKAKQVAAAFKRRRRAKWGHWMARFSWHRRRPSR